MRIIITLFYEFTILKSNNFQINNKLKIQHTFNIIA
jgi:hypothetical protein